MLNYVRHKLVAIFILHGVSIQTRLDLCGPKISRPANISAFLILRKRVYINIIYKICIYVM